MSAVRIYGIVSLAAVVLGAAAALPVEFWQTKKYTEWTDKEVGRMLLDSPWARRARIQMKGAAARVAVNAGGGPQRSRADAVSSSPPAPSQPGTDVVVRWQTALPVKQAIARFHYGDYVESSWNVTKMVYLDEPYYIVGFIGLPARLAGPNPEDLKSAATLNIRDQPPIHAVAVLADPLMGGTVNVFFFFPKLQEGARLITLADEEVEVLLDAAEMEIRQRFILKDLIYEGKPAL